SNSTHPTHLSPLSLHDALPIYARANCDSVGSPTSTNSDPRSLNVTFAVFAPIESVSSPTTKRNANPFAPPARNFSPAAIIAAMRSEEHMSELQSRGHLVCRLLL